MSYTVEQHPHGIVIMGILPVSELGTLTDYWEKLGYDVCDTFVAGHLGAALVVTSKEGSEAWRDDLGIALECTWTRLLRDQEEEQ